MCLHIASGDQRSEFDGRSIMIPGEKKDAQQKYTCVLEKASIQVPKGIRDDAHKDKVLGSFEGIGHNFKAERWLKREDEERGGHPLYVYLYE